MTASPMGLSGPDLAYPTQVVSDVQVLGALQGGVCHRLVYPCVTVLHYTSSPQPATPAGRDARRR